MGSMVPETMTGTSQPSSRSAPSIPSSAALTLRVSCAGFEQQHVRAALDQSFRLMPEAVSEFSER